MDKDFDFFGFEKAIENSQCVIFQFVKHGKLVKLINYDKSISKYRYSNDFTKKQKFTKKDKTYTKVELIRELIIENMYSACEKFNIDKIDIILEMTKG